MDLSIVIPVFNNAESLQILHHELVSACNEILSNGDYEFIFVDDGSQDESMIKLRELARFSDKNIRIVKLAKNYGQVSAIFAGYSKATGKAIITVSADLQDPIELIPKFYREFLGGCDIVIGSREGRDEGLFRRATSYMAYRVARIGHPTLPAGGFDYFLISRRAIDQILKFQGMTQFIQGAIVDLGLPTQTIPYRRKARAHGKSQWTFLRKTRFLGDILVESTFAPIRIFTGFGFLTVLISNALLLVIGWGKLHGSTPFNGFTSLAALITTIGGITILMIGILGEYLIRTLRQISLKSRYIIDSEESI
jgi:dolichol-phosphate mannosyltransferase